MTTEATVAGERALTLERVLVGVVVLLLVLAPLFTSEFFISFVLTRTLWFGLAAASLIFLAAYGGMISLSQTMLYGFAGFVVGNAVTQGGSKGLNLGLDPWVGVILGIVLTTVLGFLLGLVASRSTGLYFLMITLTFGVIGFFFFGQVTQVSGFGGINQIRAPAYIGEPGQFPERLYYTALGVSVLCYLLLHYVARTPFGLALQGIRDDPVRMSALGYNLPLHKTLAFTLGAFVASLAGVLNVWWNAQIDPASIGLGAILALLIAAVIGGINRLEGAWVGAFVVAVVEIYVRDVPVINRIIPEERFNTLIGIIFLVIVLLSPDGVIGIGQRLVRLVTGRPGPGDEGSGARAPEPEEMEATTPSV